MSKVSLILIFGIIALLVVFLILLEENPTAVISVGVLLLLIVYPLSNPPKKHKNFSLSDQEQAVRRHQGR